MRIRHIQINHWRHFKNIEMQIDPDTALVCLVGANGAGKSHILELVAACAHKLGLSQGIEIPRGDPFTEPHDFSLKIYLAESTGEIVDSYFQSDSAFYDWDRTLCINSQHNATQSNQIIITAGGIQDLDNSKNLAERIIQHLQRSKSVHFLSLDSDRAYPKKRIQSNELAQIFDTDWGGIEYTKSRSYRPSTTLYDDWLKYFLALESQAGSELMKDTRLARQTGNLDPVFKDHFSDYRKAVSSVLPHVSFIGVDSKKRTLLFNTTGLELSFNQLSGGEREIAFLIGQIDRFQLRQGLLLLDEPELHLNSDLIRSWLAYLKKTMETGQIWFATHSLEAVEAIEQKATFILERNEETRQTDVIKRLDKRPVLSALSRSVGSPAFSISALVFIYIEGEEGKGTRSLFYELTGSPQTVRFMECGSCNDVLRRVSTIKSLAKETQENIRIGGIVDRDFRTRNQVKEIEDENIYVLPVHEIENFFLHPPTLQVILQQNGYANLNSQDLIRDASDSRAGSWIYQRTMMIWNDRNLRQFNQKAKNEIKPVNWVTINQNKDEIIDRVVSAAELPPDETQKLKRFLNNSITSYKSKRTKITLWKVCEGKQVLHEVARKCGYTKVSVHVSATLEVWNRDTTNIPTQLINFRKHIGNL